MSYNNIDKSMARATEKGANLTRSLFLLFKAPKLFAYILKLFNDK